MPVTTFNRGAPYNVKLDVNGSSLAGQVASWRVNFVVVDVPIFDANVNADAADEDGYFPIVAMYLEAPLCRVGPGEDTLVYMDDGLSRCSVVADSVLIVPPVSTPPVKQQIDFRVKQSWGGINTTMLQGSANVNPSASGNKSTLKGLIGAVSGILSTGFEFWARVNAQAVQTPQPLQIRIQMIADRLGGQGFGYLSVNDINGTVLPVIKEPPPGP